MKLHLASGNAHKVAEFQSLAAASGLNVEFISAKAVGGMPAVEEDTGTFVGNARKKACALHEKLGAEAWVLSDDSGVCVDALGGGPGVESAYYAGPQADSRANLQKLYEVMKPVPDGKRGASFVCVLVLLGPLGLERVFQGECHGVLAHEPMGGAGFGYDPLFIPTGETMSYAQLGDEVKNALSHRGRAWRLLAQELAQLA